MEALKRRIIAGDTRKHREFLRTVGARWNYRMGGWYLPVYENEDAVEKIQETGLTISHVNTKSTKNSAISDLEPGHVTLSGTVTIFNSLNSYKACPFCLKKKAAGFSSCPSCGSDTLPVDRLLINVVVDDGTGAIKAKLAGRAAEIFMNLNHDQAVRIITLPPQEGRDSQVVEHRLLSFLGREVIFEGYVYLSKFSNLLEMSVRDFEFIREED